MSSATIAHWMGIRHQQSRVNFLWWGEKLYMLQKFFYHVEIVFICCLKLSGWGSEGSGEIKGDAERICNVSATVTWAGTAVVGICSTVVNNDISYLRQPFVLSYCSSSIFFGDDKHLLQDHNTIANPCVILTASAANFQVVEIVYLAKLRVNVLSFAT